MHDDRKIRTKLPQLPAFAIGLVVALVLGVSAPVLAPTTGYAQSAKPACSGVERPFYLGKKPTLVNPGGKCFLRFRMEVEVHTVASKLPELCVLARVVGSDKDYGPFCTSGENSRIRTPGPIEYLSTNRSVKAWVKLCDPKQAHC